MQAKNQLYSSRFPWILHRYCKLVVLGIFGMPGYAHRKISLYRKPSCLSAEKKINFIPHAFLKILQRLANLFWVLWAYLVTHTQNGSIVEDFNVYLHAKNKFHYSPFSWGIIFKKTLQFDWLTAFWPINWELEFCQIWHWWWNINGNISFYYRLFLRIKK